MQHGPPAVSRVALVRGDDRRGNILQALRALAAEIDLAGKQQILLKPNFVLTDHQPAATHAGAVRAVLEFLRERYAGPITIAEGPALRPAADGYRQYGYDALAAEYGATLADLNQDEPYPVHVYDWKLRPLHLSLARSVVESDFRVSVGPPKTHDVVIVTLSLKNMIMGSLRSYFSPAAGHGRGKFVQVATRFLQRAVPEWVINLPPAEWLRFRVMSSLEPSDKMKMHQSYPVINLNLALIAPLVVPHLAVIDGFEAMEGDGPSLGTVVPWRTALASTDALAADAVATALMGFDIGQIGYLHYCRLLGLGNTDPSRIELAGNSTMAECARAFQPHTTYARQRRWHLPQAEQLLRRAWPALAAPQEPDAGRDVAGRVSGGPLL